MRLPSLWESCQSPALGAARVLVGQIEGGAKGKGSYRGLAKQWRRHETLYLCRLVGGFSLALSTAVDLRRLNVNSTDY